MDAQGYPVVTMLLAIAYLPLAALAATKFFPILNPPRHRPFLFFVSGTFMLLFGVLVGYALRPDLKDGIVQFTSRGLGYLYADSSQQPLEYWAIILGIYAFSIVLSGFGLAGLKLCFHNKRYN